MVNEIIRILRVLIENQERVFSIRNLSKIRKINYKSAYNAVMKLKENDVISFKKLGNTCNVGFNNNFSPIVFNVEYTRRRDILKNSDFNEIYNRLNRLDFPFIVLLFGSHAKGTATKHSDIDLLAISDTPKRIEDVIRLIPLKIQLLSLTSQDFIKMAKSKEFSVVSEAIKKNIILIGIEDYYRLIENVKRSTNQGS